MEGKGITPGLMSRPTRVGQSVRAFIVEMCKVRVKWKNLRWASGGDDDGFPMWLGTKREFKCDGGGS